MIGLLAIASLTAAVASDRPGSEAESELGRGIRKHLEIDLLPIARWDNRILTVYSGGQRAADPASGLDFYEVRIEDGLETRDAGRALPHRALQRISKRSYAALLLKLLPGPHNAYFYRQLGVKVPAGSSMTSSSFEALRNKPAAAAWEHLLILQDFGPGGEIWYGDRRDKHAPRGLRGRPNAQFNEHPLDYLERVHILGDPTPELRAMTLPRPDWVNRELVPTSLQRATNKYPLAGDLTRFSHWAGTLA